MDIAYEIYQLISARASSPIALTPDIVDGITAYIADNGLANLMQRCPTGKQLRYLEMFLQPVLNLPDADIAMYFASYTFRRDFKRTVNLIRSEAEKKWKDASYTCAQLSALADSFYALAAQSNGFPQLHSHLARDISDAIVDLDYLAGKSASISISLQKRLLNVPDPSEL